MYVGTSVLLMLLSYAYGIAIKKYHLSRVIGFVCCQLAILFFGLWSALAIPSDGFRVAAYFAADITVYGSMLLFWSLFGQIFDSREAKRLIGMVEAGGTAACILTGFLIRPLTSLLGDRGLLLIVLPLLLGFAASAAYVSRHAFSFARPKESAERSGAGVSSLASFKYLLVMPQVRYLALLMLTGTVSVTLVDFQFKSAAGLRYQNQQLAAFFGAFYGAANIPVLVIQLFLVHRLLRRFNLFLILALMPAALLAGSLGTLISAAFGWIVATRLAVQTTSFTIDHAALQMLFFGIRKKSCSQARALVEGICKPVAIGAAGILLAVISVRIQIHTLAYGVAALALAWLCLARRNYALYLQGLIDSLGSKMLDLSAAGTHLYDRSIVMCTREALLSAKSDELPYLFSIVETLDQVDWRLEVRQLLESNNPDARAAALHYLECHGSGEDLPAALRHLSDCEPKVRQAALGVIERIGGREAVATLLESLDDCDPAVRAEAAARLFRLGEPAASKCVTGMMESGDPANRVAIAHHLGRLQFDGWKLMFLDFMQDPERSVRIAALKACSNRRDPELVPLLIHQLRDSVTCGAAADALAAFGQITLDFMKDHPDRVELRALFAGAGALAAVLVRIGSAEALRILSELFDTPESLDSARLIETYCRLLDQQPSLRPYLASISKLASHQTAEAQKRFVSLNSMSFLPGGDFLRKVLEEEYQQHLYNLFLILDVRIPGMGIRNIHSRLLSGVREDRAAALDLLENILPGNFKGSILTFLERRVTAGKLHDGLSEVVEMLKRERFEWALVGAVYAAGENKMADAVESIRRLLGHPSANVVETTRWSLAKMGSIYSNDSQLRHVERGASDGSERGSGTQDPREIGRPRGKR
jgi:HEAT repeat protein